MDREVVACASSPNPGSEGPRTVTAGTCPLYAAAHERQASSRRRDVRARVAAVRCFEEVLARDREPRLEPRARRGREDRRLHQHEDPQIVVFFRAAGKHRGRVDRDQLRKRRERERGPERRGRGRPGGERVRGEVPAKFFSLPRRRRLGEGPSSVFDRFCGVGMRSPSSFDINPPLRRGAARRAARRAPRREPRGARPTGPSGGNRTRRRPGRSARPTPAATGTASASRRRALMMGCQQLAAEECEGCLADVPVHSVAATRLPRRGEVARSVG